MSRHPYPAHIVKAVAREMIPYGPLLPGDLDDADRFLNALWDASRINSREEFYALPDEAIVHSDNNLFTDFPAHVIYWGDTND